MAESGYVLDTVKDVYSTNSHTISTLPENSTSSPFSFRMMYDLSTAVYLASAPTIYSTVITLEAGHGFSTASSQVEYINIYEGNFYTQQRVMTVSTNDITLEWGVEYPLTTAAIAKRSIKNFGIDASSTQAIYNIEIPSFTFPIKITHITVISIHSLEADLSKFMGIAELTNGVTFRKVSNELPITFGKLYANKEFLLNGFNVNFTDKGGGGKYGTEIDVSFPELEETVLTIDPALNEQYQLIVDDDLSALTSLEVTIFGKYQNYT